MPAITITDLINAKLDVDHIAEMATSLSPTCTDRLGHVKQTMSAAGNAIAQTAAGTATAARIAAEAARDAALIQSGVYATEALGRAAVADGVAFKVQGSGDVAAYEYRRTDATASVLIASYPSASLKLATRPDIYIGATDPTPWNPDCKFWFVSEYPRVLSNTDTNMLDIPAWITGRASFPIDGTPAVVIYRESPTTFKFDNSGLGTARGAIMTLNPIVGDYVINFEIKDMIALFGKYVYVSAFQGDVATDWEGTAQRKVYFVVNPNNTTVAVVYINGSGGGVVLGIGFLPYSGSKCKLRITKLGGVYTLKTMNGDGSTIAEETVNTSSVANGSTADHFILGGLNIFDGTSAFAVKISE